MFDLIGLKLPVETYILSSIRKIDHSRLEILANNMNLTAHLKGLVSTLDKRLIHHLIDI